MGLSERFAVGLGRSNIAELSFIDQLFEGLGRLLNRNIGVNSSGLEQVQLLGSPEVLVNIVNTTPQALLAVNSLSR